MRNVRFARFRPAAGRGGQVAGIALGLALCAVTVAAPPAAAANDPNAPNNAPVASPDTAVVEAGRVSMIDVLANDTDPDGDPLTLQEAFLPVVDAGNARAQAGKVRLDIVSGFVGAVQVIYRISDSRGVQVNGTLDVTVIAATTPTPAPARNHRPIAVDDDVATEHDTEVSFDLLANDTDPDGDQLSVVRVGRARHGSATLNGSVITYTPRAGYSGTDQFKYTIADPAGKRDTATVRVKVLAPAGGQPDEHPATVTRKAVESALDRLGLPTGTANGHYDAKTRRAMCTWRTVMGRKANRALPSAAEARLIVDQSSLPAALDSMVTGLNISKTCQAAFWVSSANRYRAIMAATTGKPGYGTRAGVHRVFISWRVWRYSTIYEGARMYKPMQFSGGQAVHGSAKDSYVKTYPASHGCVRMLHKDIDRLQSGGFGLGSAVRVFGAW